MKELNYKELGLKVGIELHQQLDTKYKLFCKCQNTLSEKSYNMEFVRRLRPSMSELGEVDIAALFEWKKGRRYVYEVTNDCVCLVEADEEPPHEINEEALEIALGIALALNAKPVDEVYVMRKIVIDGSNTSGFQRTALIALGGFIEDEEGETLLFSRREKDVAFAAAELILHSCDVKATALRCQDPETGAPA